MTQVLQNTALFLGALALMEPVAHLSHRYLMHGPLWCLHESHHRPRQGVFENNDLFAVFFSLPSIALIYVGTNFYPPALWAGLGIAAYGLCYFLFHDVLVHRRIDHRYRPAAGYLQRIVHAHRLHHASRNRRGAVSHGFLMAPPVARLRDQMRRLEAQGHRFDGYATSDGYACSAASDGSHKPEGIAG
jgi:beta-carotene 3-hydroxylase